MLIGTTTPPSPLLLTAEPLTRESFAPFGDVLTNPNPANTPSNTSPTTIAAGALPCGAVSANQGSAIQYRALGTQRDHYATAPSGRRGGPRVTMFVCGARTLESSDASSSARDSFRVSILERHPFTSQTFVPLGVGPSDSRSYLVIVAPTLPATDADSGLPAPEGKPGRGRPDLGRLKAFLASGNQAVTYGAGTWHAPMAALGPPGSAIDFLVFQFANDVPVEDCQEVAFGDREGENVPRIMVRIPGGSRNGGGEVKSKL
ncbi:ureidoglycolate hydrolase [Xylariomycetidae sp. FL0641]|nr:ureidoglycolate hydrolase [Xylariomycetidae sp. FL0641]